MSAHSQDEVIERHERSVVAGGSRRDPGKMAADLRGKRRSKDNAEFTEDEAVIMKRGGWTRVVSCGVLMLGLYWTAIQASATELLMQAQLLSRVYRVEAIGEVQTAFTVQHAGKEYLVGTTRLAEVTKGETSMMLENLFGENREVETPKLIGTSQREGIAIFEAPEWTKKPELDLAVGTAIAFGGEVQWIGIAEELGLWLTGKGQLSGLGVPKSWQQRGWGGMTVSGEAHPGQAGSPIVTAKHENGKAVPVVVGVLRGKMDRPGLFGMGYLPEVMKEVTGTGGAQ